MQLALVDPDSSMLPQLFPILQGSPYADSYKKKQLYKEDLNNKRLSVEGKVSRTISYYTNPQANKQAANAYKGKTLNLNNKRLTLS